MLDRLESVGRSVSPSGLVIATIGFLVTRGTVALASESTPLEFLLADALPLVLGLGLSAFGVVLTVGSFSRAYVRRTALWTVAGTVTIGGLLGLAVFGQATTMQEFSGLVIELREQGYLSSVLIGGSVGGTLTGLYAGRTVEERDRYREQSQRMAVMNRLLRDRVLNALMVIRSRAEFLEDDDTDGGNQRLRERSVEAVTERTQTIEHVVSDVSYLGGQGAGSDGPITDRGLQEPLSAALERARDRYGTTFDYVEPVQARVWADAQLEQALYLAITAAADARNEAQTVRVDVEPDGPTDTLAVQVSAAGDNGQYPGDPGEQPETATRLEIAELLVNRYDGTIETGVDTDGENKGAFVRVSLRDTSAAGTVTTFGRSSGQYGIPTPQIVMVTGAALVAGVAMGAVMASLSGVVPVIGSLYGLRNPVVGWLTHLFHSVVFGLIYAGLLAMAPTEYTRRFSVCLGIGVAWSAILWAIAAGVIMPLWLRLLGLPTMLPRLQGASLVGHAVWGLTLAGVYYPLGRWAASRSAEPTD